MSARDLQERLETCAAEMERGIVAWRQQWEERPYAEGIPAEAALDTSGRPILASLYAELASVYRALADMGDDA